MNNPQASPELASLRVQIDNIDQQLLTLLNQRALVAERVGEITNREGTPFVRPDRVAQVIEKIQTANPGPLKGAHVAAIEQRNIAKARLLYDTIDQSQFYVNKVAANCRSRMNVPFFLRDESRNDAFLAGAKERGLLQLKGHKSVGGMRASIYNAMPLAGVQALVDYMREFEQKTA